MRNCRCIQSHAIPNWLSAFYQRRVKLKRPLINSVSIRGHPSEARLLPWVLLLRRPCLMHYFQACPLMSPYHRDQGQTTVVGCIAPNTFGFRHLHSCTANTADPSLHPVPCHAARLSGSPRSPVGAKTNTRLCGHSELLPLKSSS